MEIFTESTLSKSLQNALIAHGIWKEACPVPLTRLRLLTLSYYDFSGDVHHDGEMVVLEAVAPQVLAIFRELYRQHFPIHSIKGIEAYAGNDEASMADNNSSCFNFREITGGGLPSIHSYGLAIDINPIQNPYVAPDREYTGKANVLPPEGLGFLNRTNARPGMVEPIVGVFKQHGFTIWGGNWNDPLDWQHFQPPRPVAMQLAAMEPAEATAFFATSCA